MSGTSCDGVDLVLTEIRGSGTSTQFQLIESFHQSYTSAQKKGLLSLLANGMGDVKSVSQANFYLARLWAAGIKKMLTVKDIVVKKPSDEEIATCKSWPIWQCQPSTFDWAYTQTETCLLLEGKVTVKDDKDSVAFGPGDMVTFPNGLECTWQVTEPVKKHYDFK